MTIPASTGTNGTAQNITCTFTNTQVPSIGLVKSVSSVTDVNGNGQRDAGDKINYSFLVTNTGGVGPDRSRGHRPEGHRHQLPRARRWRSARA